MRLLRFPVLAAVLSFAVGILCVSLWFIKSPTLADSSKEPLRFVTPVEQAKNETVITLQRSVCFGSCPDYKLTVSSDGSVIFEGHKFVKVTKTIKSTINQEKIKQLVDEFEKADYFSLKDKYQTEEDGCPTVWTDNPTAITSIKLNGKSKSITHYYGCQDKQGDSIYPKGLTELETKIDEIVGTKQWIK